MPTVLRIGRYRFFFYSNENDEPPHVHVKAGEDEAKFWLYPVTLETNYGFRSRELTEIRALVNNHAVQLIEAWNEYFDQE